MFEMYAPASIGNFAVGFDALGAALAKIDGGLLGDIVQVSASQQDSFVCSGDYASRLPVDPLENLAYQCFVYFREHLAPDMPPLRLELKKNLPIGSGLGSSACSVVATFAALDKFANTQLSKVQLIELMADFEETVSGGRHYDNITPCYLGGLQLTGDLIPNKSIRLPVSGNWYYVVAFPGVSLNTAKARSVLPKEISLHHSVEFAQRLSAFSSFLLMEKYDLALSIMADHIAEPHRTPLIKDFNQAKETLPALGAKVISISGSGPTLFAVCTDLAAAERCAFWLENGYIGDQGFCHICQLDHLGTRVLENGGQHATA